MTGNNFSNPANCVSPPKGEEPSSSASPNESINYEAINDEEINDEESPEYKMTDFQKARMERNRQKALLLRQARLQAHPYKNISKGDTTSVIHISNSRMIDTGGGFLIEQNQLEEQEAQPITITQDPAPIIESERPHCLTCELPLYDSFLYRSFLYPVCDSCKDDDDEHSLITRTEARREYFLKKCDLDMREPLLKFILRKNPHNPRWGDMKLYLRLQVEERALEVWGSIEEIEKQYDLLEARRQKARNNKFKKQVRTLRMAVRSSMYHKQVEGHVHDLDAEQYDDEKDEYFRVCRTCNYRNSYEKM
nr:EOG090X0KP6 [Sida crystallina]